MMKKLVLVNLLFSTLCFSSTVDTVLLDSIKSKIKTVKFFKNITKDTIRVDKAFAKYINSLDNSIDVFKSFDSSDIEYIYLFDRVSKKNALYKPNGDIDKDIFLTLETIESGVEFYIKTKVKKNIKLKLKGLSGVCKKYYDDKSYNSILDSGIDKKYTHSDDNSIAISSRYYSNHLKGRYTDTQVMLIYPKIEKYTKSIATIGIGRPTAMLRFDKSYLGKEYYIYEYQNDQCYKGKFSQNSFDFMELKKIK